MFRAMGDDPLAQPGPWNAVAEGYDEEWTDQQPEIADRAIAIVLGDTPPPARVLDVATGPGYFAARIANRVERVVAVDFADRMIERVRARLDRDHISNVDTDVMDGQALALPDASFDAAVSLFGWFMFPDRARGLAELRRVVREGGRILVTSWYPPDRNTSIGAAMTALREALPDLPRPKGPLPTQQPDVIAGELGAAGLRDVTIETVTSDVQFESAAAYWRKMERAGAPMALLKKKLGDEAWCRAADTAVEKLRARLGDGPITLVAEAIFAHAVR